MRSPCGDSLLSRSDVAIAIARYDLKLTRLLSPCRYAGALTCPVWQHAAARTAVPARCATRTEQAVIGASRPSGNSRADKPAKAFAADRQDYMPPLRRAANPITATSSASKAIAHTDNAGVVAICAAPAAIVTVSFASLQAVVEAALAASPL